MFIERSVSFGVKKQALDYYRERATLSHSCFGPRALIQTHGLCFYFFSLLGLSPEAPPLRFTVSFCSICSLILDS